ncbi:MAG: capsular polysaccharide synthesis protein [Bacteroidota bacterium]|nr:capsular polysaccharide synthesis protein [Bacteroidota bacterium]
MSDSQNNIITTKIELDLILKQNSVPMVVWCFWYDGQMNENRTRSFEMMKSHLGVPLCLVTKNNLHQFILPDFPLHPVFDWLSDVHKSDYLRIYLHHHYGGGWHDIKPTQLSYKTVWDEFANPEVYLVGKPEIKGGPAKVKDRNGNWMPKFWKDLVATNRWVGKANTPLSREMFREINQLLDKNSETLRRNPARHPYDKKRNKIKQWLRFENNDYPLEWTVFGNIFHPLNYKFRQNIKRTLPADDIENLGLPYR